MKRIAVSNSARSSARFSKKGRVKAHRVTSRMTNGTPRTGAMSAHMANMREQNGPRGVRAAERGRTQVARVCECVLLGDHPAHRDAHQVEVGHAERVDRRLRVVGQ